MLSLPYWAIRAFTAFFRVSVIDFIAGSLSLNKLLYQFIKPTQSIFWEWDKESSSFFSSPLGEVSLLFSFSFLFFLFTFTLLLLCSLSL
nr:MAG TPA: hypothetical protein [Caudoviricetes sp.]